MNLRHKVIELTPTDICLEVFMGDRKDMINLLRKDHEKNKKKRRKSYWKKVIGDSPCVVGMGNHIYMFLFNDDLQTIVHETVHATWFLDDIVEFNYDFQNQEMQAYYVDYIFSEIMSMR